MKTKGLTEPAPRARRPTIIDMIALRYRQDPGLDFLQFCSHEDLKDFCDVLSTGRFGEQLCGEPRYCANINDLPKVWDLIAAELQRYGGDTVVSLLFRGGRGVLYRKILKDVCAHQKVKIADDEDFAVIESRLLLELLKRMLDNMSEGERTEFARTRKSSLVAENSILRGLRPQQFLQLFKRRSLWGGLHLSSSH